MEFSLPPAVQASGIEAERLRMLRRPQLAGTLASLGVALLAGIEFWGAENEACRSFQK